MKHVFHFIYFLIFWSFFAVKAFGVTFAAWSWWWLLLPIMPWLGLAVAHFGL